MSVKFDLILDIRSGSIGACVYTYEKKSLVPTCLYSTRLQIPLQEQFDPARALSDVSAGLKTLLPDVVKNVPGHPGNVTAIIGTPWFVCQTRNVSYKGATPIAASDRFVNNLLLEEAKNFSSEHYPGQVAEIIERQVQKILLNGYYTPNPLGKKAKEIDVSFYISMAQKDFLDLVRKHVAEVYHHTQVRFQTFTWTAWQALSTTLLKAGNDLVFLDIGGEVSEWTLVQEGLIMESVTFSMGAHGIVRKVAQAFGVPLDEGRTLYHAYREGRVSAAVESKIEEIMLAVKTDWATSLGEILQTLSGTHILPTSYAVVGYPESCKMFCEAVDDPSLKNLLGAPGTGTCLVPEKDELGSFYKEGHFGKPDIFMVLEMIFVDKIARLRYNK